MQYLDRWFNLRPSNTEPVVKLVMEADSAETLERRGVSRMRRRMDQEAGR